MECFFIDCSKNGINIYIIFIEDFFAKLIIIFENTSQQLKKHLIDRLIAENGSQHSAEDGDVAEMLGGILVNPAADFANSPKLFTSGNTRYMDKTIKHSPYQFIVITRQVMP